MQAVPLVVTTEWLNRQITQQSTEKLRILDVTWYSSKDAMEDFSK
jgi:3-mercaptopyruvate sulfurtransferase SseA